MNIIIIFYVHKHNFNLQLPTLLVSYEKFRALKRDMNSRNIVKYQPTIGSKLCFNVVTFSQQIYLVESTNPLELSYCSHVNMYICMHTIVIYIRRIRRNALMPLLSPPS